MLQVSQETETNITIRNISARSQHNYYQTQSRYLKALQAQICGNVTSDKKSRLTDAFDDFSVR